MQNTSKTADMDIEICASSLPRFAASVAASNAILTSLHIGWKGTFKLPKFKGGMTFRHLQNLTIEIGILTTQIMWPNMPQLRSLRIKRSVLCDGSADFRPPDFTSFPPLVRVELIKTYLQIRDGRDILSTGELKVGIQYLVVFDSNLPSFTIFPSSSISHWATLRHLTLVTDKWPKAGHPMTSLPNLEVLTMIQLIRDEVTFPYVWDDTGSMFDSLVPLLSEAHLTPSRVL